MKKFLNQQKGITLIALVITIIVLIILAVVSINLILGENGILQKTQYASETYKLKSAQEILELKIAAIDMEAMTKCLRNATLGEVAEGLDADTEIQYVLPTSQVAATQPIIPENATEIYTKLKAYPYEFEINRDLKISKILETDGTEIVIKKDVTVKFNANGGQVALSEKTATNGNAFGELPIPTKESCAFMGWYTELTYQNKITSENVVNSNDDITLYAKWITLNETWEKTYTGEVQEFVVPYTGTYKLEVAGGGGTSEPGYSTKGSYAKGTVDLTEGTVLYIYVGGRETTFNGGGTGGGTTKNPWAETVQSTNGSGATDIRLIQSTAEDGWSGDTSLSSRIITAGGGGGARKCVGRSFNGATPLNKCFDSTTQMYGAYGIDGEMSNGVLGKGSNDVYGTSVLTDSQDMGWSVSGGGGGGWYGGATVAYNLSGTYTNILERRQGMTSAGTPINNWVTINGNRMCGVNTHAYAGTSYIQNNYSYNANTYTFTDTQTLANYNQGNGYARITILSVNQ